MENSGNFLSNEHKNFYFLGKMSEKNEVKVAYPSYKNDVSALHKFFFSSDFLIVESINHYPSIFFKWKYKIKNKQTPFTSCSLKHAQITDRQ